MNHLLALVQELKKEKKIYIYLSLTNAKLSSLYQFPLFFIAHHEKYCICGGLATGTP